MNNKKSRPTYLKDLLFICGMAAAAAYLSWNLSINFLESSILFFVPPALYLNINSPKAIKRCLFFSFIFMLGSVAIDYAALNDKAWAVPTIFPFKLFGVVQIEDLVWFFLLSYLILSYFEHFYDRLKHKTVGGRMPYLYLVVIIVNAAWIISTLWLGHPYDITYFYLKCGLLLCLLPVLAFLFEFPRFMSTLLLTMPYFAGLSLLEEIVSLHKGYWSFPGNHFIGRIHIIGYAFPVEEMVFWIILFSSVVIAYFELFDDNRLKFRRP